MLNPDGVIVGNNRCNLTGYDLNRSWDFDKEFQKSACPEIYYVSEMLENILESRKVELFVDLHGHK